jgi:AraC-like DNA-binding protein
MSRRRTASSRLIFEQKDFGLPGLVLLGRFQHAVSVSAIPAHTHKGAIEICFLERGVQSFRVKGAVHRMVGNDQFFTLPDEVHDTANLPEERGILYWLILKLEPARDFLGLARTPGARLKRELLRMPARHFRAHPDCAAVLRELIDLLGEGRAMPTAQRHLRQQSLLLHYLTLTIAASHKGLRGSATPLMQRVLHHIENHLEDPVHVPRLAEVARLSESRFKARFKREMGVPPGEFWLRKKIEKASRLLRKQSVTRVAFDLGFSSSQYFATVFKRYTLVNPSQFRRS